MLLARLHGLDERYCESRHPARAGFVRVQRAWTEVLGPSIAQYTRQVYVRDRVLYVSLTSSVLRNELSYCRDRLVKSLNDYAKASVIDRIVLR